MAIKAATGEIDITKAEVEMMEITMITEKVVEAAMLLITERNPNTMALEMTSQNSKSMLRSSQMTKRRK